MSEHTQTPITLELVGQVLQRSFILGFAFLLVVSLPMLLLGDQIYAIHSKLFPMSREAHTMLIFSWIGDFKLVVFGVFLIPWLAVRGTLNRR